MKHAERVMSSGSSDPSDENDLEHVIVKVSGRGTASMARACLSADRCSTCAKLGILRRHTSEKLCRR